MSQNISPSSSIYPPSPKSDRKKLLNPGRAYRRKVLLVLFGLIAFWLIYFVLIAFGIWGFVQLCLIPMFHIRYGILLKLGLLAMAGMFIIFLFKFLFKSWKWDDESLLEIKESEQPELFAFLGQLSKEVGAPFPRKVFVNQDINARVFYSNPLLSLFLPTGKNLHIGLGLVNSLNLTEFKAVLAHEFGHFSQGSMRLGTYVYMANRIIHDMVYSRDRWDIWFDQWRSSDFRLAIFAWALSPFVWIVRTVMNAMYRGLNLLQSSLSRQMEFHADRVAVSAAGSSAIVHALYKLDAAAEALNFANHQVRSAFDHKLYTNDLFYHQRKAYEYLANNQSDFRDKLLENVVNPKLENSVYLFKKEDTHVPDMYASHPAGYLRETNAKAIFVEGLEDKRSAWVLFRNPDILSQKVTKHLLYTALGLPQTAVFTAAPTVQGFIEEELKETTFDPRYHGYYGNRYLSVPNTVDVDILSQTFGLENEGEVERQFQQLYGDGFKEAFLKIVSEEQELQKMIALIPLAQQNRPVQYKEKTYQLIELESEIENYQKLKGPQHSDWFQKRDSFMYALHLRALQIMQKSSDGFLARYHFQWKLQETLHKLEEVYNHFGQIVQALRGKTQLEKSEVEIVADALIDCSAVANEALDKISDLAIPPLNNMDGVLDLKNFIAPEPLPPFTQESIVGKEVAAFDTQLQGALNRSLRIFRKNIGRLVQEMEEIEAAWLGRGKEVKISQAVTHILH